MSQLLVMERMILPRFISPKDLSSQCECREPVGDYLITEGSYREKGVGTVSSLILRRLCRYILRGSHLSICQNLRLK